MTSLKSAGGLEALLDSSLSVHANLLREDNKPNEREEKDFEMDHFLETTCLGGAHVIPSVWPFSTPSAFPKAIPNVVLRSFRKVSRSWEPSSKSLNQQGVYVKRFKPRMSSIIEPVHASQCKFCSQGPQAMFQTF